MEANPQAWNVERTIDGKKKRFSRVAFEDSGVVGLDVRLSHAGGRLLASSRAVAINRMQPGDAAFQGRRKLVGMKVDSYEREGRLWRELA